MIIIKTPQPDTEERLVLVPVRRIVPESRDATPDDLARAGYVPLAAFVGPLDLLTPPTLDGVLEAIHSVREAVATECDRQHDEAMARAEKAERERDGARRDLGKVAMAASAAGWNGSDNPKAVWGFVAHLADERDEALALIEATRQATGIAAKAADMPKAIAEVVANRKAVSELACRLERERDEARDSVDEYRSRADMVPGLAHEVATLRAELARLTATEPTDEELCDLYESAWDACPGNASESKLAALRAVAARVRQERPGVDEEAVSEIVRVGLAQCDALRRTVAKLTERCDQFEGERNAIAFVLSTPAERRKDAEIGSLGYRTLARLLGEVKP